MSKFVYVVVKTNPASEGAPRAFSSANKVVAYIMDIYRDHKFMNSMKPGHPCNGKFIKEISPYTLKEVLNQETYFKIVHGEYHSNFARVEKVAVW